MQLFILLLQLLILYPVIHLSVAEVFRLIYIVTRSRDMSFAWIAVICLPGTIIHELAHFIAATVLFLPVDEIRVWPEWHNNHIRLGKVEYAKADAIRSVLVGIAPLFGAIFFFFLLYVFHIFPSNTIWVNVLMGFVLFSVTANMFSSKQDLVDLIYMIPLAIIIGAVWYITGFSIRLHVPLDLVSRISTVLQFVNFCITISLVIHVGVIVIIKSLWILIKR